MILIAAGANLNSAELSRSLKVWIVVETHRKGSEIDRNRCVSVCGHRPGHFGLGFVGFGDRFGPQIVDFRPGS